MPGILLSVKGMMRSLCWRWCWRWCWEWGWQDGSSFALKLSRISAPLSWPWSSLWCPGECWVCPRTKRWHSNWRRKWRWHWMPWWDGWCWLKKPWLCSHDDRWQQSWWYCSWRIDYDVPHKAMGRGVQPRHLIDLGQLHRVADHWSPPLLNYWECTCTVLWWWASWCHCLLCFFARWRCSAGKVNFRESRLCRIGLVWWWGWCGMADYHFYRASSCCELLSSLSLGRIVS